MSPIILDHEAEQKRWDAEVDRKWAKTRQRFRKSFHIKKRPLEFYILNDGHVTELAQLVATAKNMKINIVELMARAVMRGPVPESEAKLAFSHTIPGAPRAARPILGPDGKPISFA